MDDVINIDKSQLEANDDLFVGTIDVNPHRSVWTSDGWKHDAGEELPIFSQNNAQEDGINFIPNSCEISAYTQHKKMFELICNLAQMPAQRKELTEGLDFLHYRMREMAINKTAEFCLDKSNADAADGTASNEGEKEKDEMMSVTKHGLQSFTAISRQVKHIRIRAPYSPSRQNRKKTA